MGRNLSMFNCPISFQVLDVCVQTLCIEPRCKQAASETLRTDVICINLAVPLRQMYSVSAEFLKSPSRGDYNMMYESNLKFTRTPGLQWTKFPYPKNSTADRVARRTPGTQVYQNHLHFYNIYQIMNVLVQTDRILRLF